MQRDRVLLEFVAQLHQVTQVSRESVKLPDDDVGSVARFDRCQQLLQARAQHVLAREARIGDDGDLAEVVQCRIGPQLVRLALDRPALLRLFLRRYTAVRQG